jgi:hypothetical protein
MTHKIAIASAVRNDERLLFFKVTLRSAVLIELHALRNASMDEPQHLQESNSLAI